MPAGQSPPCEPREAAGGCSGTGGEPPGPSWGCHGGAASPGALITPPTPGIWGAVNSALLLQVCSPRPPLHPVGSKESLFSSTITASEEAMTVLEEVVMYTFQQCVYYISKVRAPREGR